MKALLSLSVGLACAAGAAAPLKPVRTIPLPGVEGRIDHFTVDTAGQRLFVAALGNNSVEVVDLAAGKVQRSLTGFAEPQGLLYVREWKRLFVACGGDGSVRMLDGTSFGLLGTAKLDDDADNLRYDASAGRVYVGYGSGGLAALNARTGARLQDIRLTAHPESFQLESGGPRIFVNVPRAHTIAVIDRAKGAVVGQWSLDTLESNFPMALDEADRRIFIATRRPARLVVYDLDSGHQVAAVALHGDCDDLFYAPAQRVIIASCGEGFIDVFHAQSPEHYERRESVPTVRGARTCFLTGQTLYLAIPKSASVDAEIRIFDIGG